MHLATSEQNLEWRGLGVARERWLRPAVGFNHPRDVLKDPFLDNPEKRAVLSSWASAHPSPYPSRTSARR